MSHFYTINYIQFTVILNVWLTTSQIMAHTPKEVWYGLAAEGSVLTVYLEVLCKLSWSSSLVSHHAHPEEGQQRPEHIPLASTQ